MTTSPSLSVFININKIALIILQLRYRLPAITAVYEWMDEPSQVELRTVFRSWASLESWANCNLTDSTTGEHKDTAVQITLSVSGATYRAFQLHAITLDST